MSPILKTLPLVLALVAAPSLAAAADQHAAHHPKAGVVPKAAHKEAEGHAAHDCPMMHDSHGAMPQGAAGQMAGNDHGAMMKDGRMHCMPATGDGAAAKPQSGGTVNDHDHDHDHDQTAPK